MLHFYAYCILSFFTDRISQARAHPERGGPTLEQALWAAGLFVAAVALIAVIVNAITSRQEQIF